MKNLMMSLVLVVLSTSALAGGLTLDREPFLDACVDTIYTTDPLINMALAMDKTMGPGVKGEIREMCGCYGDKIDARGATGRYNEEHFNWMIGNLFHYFQVRDVRQIDSGVRVDVINDIKQCSPHMLSMSL